MPGKMGSYQDKKKKIKDLDRAGDVGAKRVSNPIDRLQEDMDRDAENEKGITDYIRNIFD